LRLKGDVSAEDAVQKLEETRWVKDDENPPKVEVEEDGSEIWKKLGTLLYTEPKYPERKRRRRVRKGRKWRR